MGKDPDTIREEIAATRAGMADTVDALAYKSDVKERSKDKVRGLVSKPKDAVMSIKDTVMGTVQEHTPDRSTIHDATHAVSQAPGHVVGGAKRAGGVMRENPIGLAVGGLAAGFVAGLVLPNTKIEDERFGPMADQLKETVKESGQELLEQGKDAAQAAAGAAKDAVKEEGADAAMELKSTAKDKAGEVRDTVGSGTTTY